MLRSARLVEAIPGSEVQLFLACTGSVIQPPAVCRRPVSQKVYYTAARVPPRTRKITGSVTLVSIFRTAVQRDRPPGYRVRPVAATAFIRERCDDWLQKPIFRHYYFTLLFSRPLILLTHAPRTRLRLWKFVLKHVSTNFLSTW